MDKYTRLMELIEAVPSVKLGFFPTPLHKLERLSAELGVELYIKRDDLSGICQFGGNKIRKLEYLIADAEIKNCDTVVTYGATQSNSVMETITAARLHGMHPIAWLYSLVPPVEGDVRGNLLLDTIFGAEIHIEQGLDGKARIAALGQEQIDRLEKQGHRCCNIPTGASTPLGCIGFIRAYAELYSQMSELGISDDYRIFTATGTGGTLAGLCAGRSAIGNRAGITGISVLDKDEGYEASIAELATASLERLGAGGAVNAEDVDVDRGWYLPGYEQPGEEANAAIKRLARTEGVLTDPVYSGKGFYGMLEHIKTGRVPQGSSVVFWHTGGATALFSEREIIGSLSRA